MRQHVEAHANNDGNCRGSDLQKVLVFIVYIVNQRPNI
jgi:hypothetical protein